jgi:hypothetical protein
MLSVTSVTALQTTCHQSSVAASSGALGMPPVSGHRVSKHRRLRLHRPLLQDGASQLSLSRRLRRLAPQALPAQARRSPAGPAASCGAGYPGSVACTLPRPGPNATACPKPRGPRELPRGRSANAVGLVVLRRGWSRSDSPDNGFGYSGPKKNRAFMLLETRDIPVLHLAKWTYSSPRTTKWPQRPLPLTGGRP